MPLLLRFALDQLFLRFLFLPGAAELTGGQRGRNARRWSRDPVRTGMDCTDRVRCGIKTPEDGRHKTYSVRQHTHSNIQSLAIQNCWVWSFQNFGQGLEELVSTALTKPLTPLLGVTVPPRLFFLVEERGALKGEPLGMDQEHNCLSIPSHLVHCLCWCVPF